MSSKGAPTSNGLRGKRPSSSFPPGPVAGNSSKKPCTGSMVVPPSRTSFMPPPAPPFKEEMDTPPRPSHASSVYLHSHYLLDQDKANTSLVTNLRKGALSPGDKQLLSPLSKEELEGMGYLYIFKAASVSEELSSRPDGVSLIPPNDAQKRKLEDMIESLGNENAKLGETKKEMMSRRQQLERKVRKLQKKAASHESAPKKEVEKAVMDFPHFKEGKNYLEAYWKAS
ncbi:UNVERIFIED_CONTAM: hypothetical protein Sindi_1388100 [Sesamum indicum]